MPRAGSGWAIGSYSGSAIGPASSAFTKVGSSTPSGLVPHCQQTSNWSSTAAWHFGQVHIGLGPRRRACWERLDCGRSFSLPPVGEGRGGGSRDRQPHLSRLPPTLTLPRKGGGD